MWRCFWHSFVCVEIPVYMCVFFFVNSHEKWGKHLRRCLHKIEIVRTFTINKTKVQLRSKQVAVKVLFCFILWFVHAKFSLPLEDCHKNGAKYYFYCLNNNRIGYTWMWRQHTADRWLNETKRKTLHNGIGDPIKWRSVFAWIAIKSWTFGVDLLFVYIWNFPSNSPNYTCLVDCEGTVRSNRINLMIFNVYRNDWNAYVSIVSYIVCCVFFSKLKIKIGCFT